MSLYNMLFGMNPFAKVLLAMLGLTENDVPRFRDCYLNEAGEIVIYTRTGGGNREWYQVENDALTEVAGYLGDDDDDFDCTYAYFRYKAPEKCKEVLDEIKSLGGSDNASKKWSESLEKLRSGSKDNATKEMLNRIQPVMDSLFKKIESGESGVVEV